MKAKQLTDVTVKTDFLDSLGKGALEAEMVAAPSILVVALPA